MTERKRRMRTTNKERYREPRKPYDPAPINPNWDSPSVRMLQDIIAKNRAANARAASEGIERVKANRPHDQK